MKNVKYMNEPESQQSCGSHKDRDEAPAYATLDVPLAYLQGAAA